MKQLDEIIELLSSSKNSLTDALLKSKVLLYRIDQQEIVSWINKELNGYKRLDDIPDYRTVHFEVKANITDGYVTHKSHILPIMHVNNKIREQYFPKMITESLPEIENLIKNDCPNLIVNLPMELNGLLGKKLINGYVVQSAWREYSPASFANIKDQIRSRMLDFILTLEADIPDLEKLIHLKGGYAKSTIKEMFNNAVFGDHTIIQLGNSNSQNVSNKTVKNDFKSLAELLKDNGIEKTDIDELHQAIKADSDTNFIPSKKDEFGKSVKAWLSQMLHKAIETSWQIEISVAAGLLTEALNSYYDLI